MNIRYKLESIIETEYKFNYDYDFQGINPDDVSIQIGHSIKPKMDDDRITISMKVNIVHNDTTLVSNAIAMTFFLSPLKNILAFDNNGNVITQNSMILDSFMIATTGALRGVLMKNLKGTSLSFVTIPLIPIEKLKR